MAETARAAGLVKIGQLARLCGVSPDTLRHYERLGLLRPAGRTRGGYRFYGPDAAGRVRVVRAALSVGFTLAELSRLLGMRDAGRPPCHAVRALAVAKLEELDRRLKGMIRLRAGLRTILQAWDVRLKVTPAGARAGLLDLLASGEFDPALDTERGRSVGASDRSREGERRDLRRARQQHRRDLRPSPSREERAGVRQRGCGIGRRKSGP